MWSYDVALAAEPGSATNASDLVARHLVEAGLPELVDDVRLVTSELATNVILHARTSFAVAISATHGSVRTRVRDGSKATSGWTLAASTDLDGRGLTIVAALSTSSGVG